MKKKWEIFWLMAVVVASILMTQFSAMAADKVIVIPMFSSGDEIPTVTSKTGRVWMDRNLGAIRVAGSESDSLSYGWLYQWGRPADGHESRTSPVTAVDDLSSGAVPGHGNFIRVVTGPPFDWTTPQDNTLWEGESGTNNPCPPGFRIPSTEEWDAEIDTWSSTNAEGAISSDLRLPMAGYRLYSTGSIVSEGIGGLYWTSTDVGAQSTMKWIYGIAITNNNIARAYAGSVRCIRN